VVQEDAPKKWNASMIASKEEVRKFLSSAISELDFKNVEGCLDFVSRAKAKL
jgi:hypothetical protein